MPTVRDILMEMDVEGYARQVEQLYYPGQPMPVSEGIEPLDATGPIIEPLAEDIHRMMKDRGVPGCVFLTSGLRTTNVVELPTMWGALTWNEDRTMLGVDLDELRKDFSPKDVICRLAASQHQCRALAHALSHSADQMNDMVHMLGRVLTQELEKAGADLPASVRQALVRAMGDGPNSMH